VKEQLNIKERHLNLENERNNRLINEKQVIQEEINKLKEILKGNVSLLQAK